VVHFILSFAVLFVQNAIADNRSSFHMNNTGSWSPLYLGTTLDAWYDASDASTLFQDNSATIKAVSGNSVAVWKDKTVHQYNAVQTTSAQRPTLTSQGMVFAGNSTQTNMVSSLSLASFTTTNQGSVFIALKPASGNGGYVGIVNFRVGSGSNDTGLIMNGGGSQLAMDWWTDGLYNWSPGDTFTVGTAAVAGFVNSGSAQVFSFNGTTYSHSTTTSIPSGSTNYMVLGQDTYSPSSRSFSGTIYEVVIVNTALSIANRQMLEGYLAWKWGTQALLPSGHPYQHFAP
jgi:hypothetical protein